MNKKTKIGLGIGGAIVAGALIFSSTAGGQTIEIIDNGGALEHQKVTVTSKEQKEIITTHFDGTLSDLVNEELPRLYDQRDSINAQIAEKEALKIEIEKELGKLPAREEPIENPVEPIE